MDWENWKLCMYAYQKSRAMTYHEGHTETGHKLGSQWIRADLAKNHCRSVLGSYWAD